MRVLVYGDLNLDLFFVLDVNTVELKDVSYVSRAGVAMPGGCGGNVSVALSRLGLEPILVSAVGEDPFGAVLLDDLARERVSKTNVRVVDGVLTGVMAVILRRGGERTIIGYRGANAYNTLEEEEAEALVEVSDYVYVSGFTFNNVDGGKTVEYLVDSTAKLGVPVGIDLGGIPASFLLGRLVKYRGLIHDVFLNLDELREAFGGDLSSSIESLASILEPRNIFLKMGSKGSLVYSGGKATLVEPVRVERVVDTTGCGDAYNAGTIYGLKAGLSPEHRALLGNLLGAYKVRGLGARHLPRSLGDLKRFVEEHARDSALVLKDML